jgi:hypothetical protein
MDRKRSAQTNSGIHLKIRRPADARLFVEAQICALLSIRPVAMVEQRHLEVAGAEEHVEP